MPAIGIKQYPNLVKRNGFMPLGRVPVWKNQMPAMGYLQSTGDPLGMDSLAEKPLVGPPGYVGSVQIPGPGEVPPVVVSGEPEIMGMQLKGLLVGAAVGVAATMIIKALI